jgi:ABC-type transporter lipoprotein component MlaA
VFTIYNDTVSKSVRATLSNFTHNYLSKITVIKRIKSINPRIIVV